MPVCTCCVRNCIINHAARALHVPDITIFTSFVENTRKLSRQFFLSVSLFLANSFFCHRHDKVRFQKCTSPNRKLVATSPYIRIWLIISQLHNNLLLIIARYFTSHLIAQNREKCVVYEATQKFAINL